MMQAETEDDMTSSIIVIVTYLLRQVPKLIEGQEQGSYG